MSDTVLVVIKNQSITLCHRPVTRRMRVMKKDSLDTQHAVMPLKVTAGANRYLSSHPTKIFAPSFRPSPNLVIHRAMTMKMPAMICRLLC